MKIFPLSRSVTLVCIGLFMALTIITSLTTYSIYTHSMFSRYQKQMTSILDYIENNLDKEDMAVCARTYEESEAYKKFQVFLDNLADSYTDVNNLYILQFLPPEESVRVREICAGFTQWEREYAPETVLFLGDTGEDWFSSEMEDKFYSIQKGYKDIFLYDPSYWGEDYTLARPLVSASGDHYALLCVDVAVKDINRVVYLNVYINLGVIVGCGILFTIILIRWLRSSVITPLLTLEKSVSDYAASAEGRKEPEELLYTPPKLGVRNEVRRLAEEVRKLSVCMRDYVKKVLLAEKETRGLKEQVLQDPLTLVKSKAAYNLEAEILQGNIEKGLAEFAILMADMNNLKIINDRYGHEHGNEYIIGGCHLICDIFAHSPVFRVGGDEFVVILQGRDFDQREELLRALKSRIEASMGDQSLEPWERFSVAVGMSELQDGDDLDSVFRRADKAMYEEKARIKALFA